MFLSPINFEPWKTKEDLAFRNKIILFNLNPPPKFKIKAKIILKFFFFYQLLIFVFKYKLDNQNKKFKPHYIFKKISIFGFTILSIKSLNLYRFINEIIISKYVQLIYKHIFFFSTNHIQFPFNSQTSKPMFISIYINVYNKC